MRRLCEKRRIRVKPNADRSREADRGALRFGQNVADVPLAHAAARFPSPLHDRGAFNRLIEAGDDEEDPVGSREVILLKRKL